MVGFTGLAGFAAICAGAFEACMPETPVLAYIVLVGPAIPPRPVRVIAADLDDTVDVYLAGLISDVVVAIAVLDRSVYIDSSVLDRGIGVLGLSGSRTEKDHRRCNQGTKEPAE